MWRSPVPFAKMSRLSLLVIAIAVMSVASMHAQTAPTPPPCATKAALQREQVLQLIGNKKAPDEAIISLINGCHVNFSMDPSTIEQLANAGASKAVMDALDRDTLSRLSLAQARSEVAALENRKRANEGPVNSERDAALQKADTDYAVQRKKIEQDTFRTSAQKNADLATLDRGHDAERSRTLDRFAAQLAQKNELLDRRIGLLRQSLYAVADPGLKYIAYSADDSRLSAAIGGEEFWFTVPPPRAKSMYEQWSAVKVMQRYEDQDSRERLLMEATNVEPVAGRSRAAIAGPIAAGTVSGAPNGSATVAPKVGQFVCPGAVIVDIDAAMRARVNGGFSGKSVGVPDRAVTAPLKIVEVDPKGVGLFRVEGSQVNYVLKSGPAPASSCSLATSDTPAGSDAVLTLRSGFQVRPGVQTPLAGMPYTLLRDDIETAWNKAGIRVPRGMTPGSFVVQTCTTSDQSAISRTLEACRRITDPLNADAATYTDADANGFGIFPDVPAGTYYLFVTVTYNNRNYFWTQQVELKSGVNSITLDQNNATEIH